MQFNGTARNYTPSDTAPVATFSYILVGGDSGDVVLERDSGNQTLTGVPAGVWMPVGPAVKRIRATNTTATNIFVS